MPHRYKPGERVGLAFGFHDQDAVGHYEITALLPARPGGQPQYAIKGSDGRERVIGERQIGGPKKLGSAERPHRAQNPITCELNRLPDETTAADPTSAAQLNFSGGQLDGAPAFDPTGQKIGTVAQIRGAGRSLRVVIEVGGFLGTGARPVVLDGGEIQFARAPDGAIRAVITVSKDALRQRATHSEK